MTGILTATVLQLQTSVFGSPTRKQNRAPPELYKAPAPAINKTTPPETERSQLVARGRLAPPTPRPDAAPVNGSVVQLGAFRDEQQAEAAWKMISARSPSVASMEKLIVRFPGGFRLRAKVVSFGEAKGSCNAIKASGQDCFVVR
jgi:hypothetical protein